MSNLELTVKYLGKKLIENSKCVICYNHIDNGQVFLPCNHYEVCSYCYSCLTNNKCPICKSRIINMITINSNRKKRGCFPTWWPEKI